MNMIDVFIEVALLVIALSLDSFAAGFAYGIKQIRIPAISTVIIAAVSTITLAFSIFAGTLLSNLIPASITVYISFGILFLLGIIKLFDRSCMCPAYKANKDNDNVLSPFEAFSLSAALSIDSIAAGIGAGFLPLYAIASIGASFFMGIIAILAGSFLGKIISRHFNCNLCWVSGLLLILLAFMKLF